MDPYAVEEIEALEDQVDIILDEVFENYDIILLSMLLHVWILIRFKKLSLCCYDKFFVKEV